MEPSFAYKLKTEICENKAFRLRRKWAQAYGLFLFGHRFNREKIALYTEDEGIARLYEWFAKSLAGKEADVRRTRVKNIIRLEVSSQTSRDRLLSVLGEGDGIPLDKLSRQEDRAAFLSGAFLACGNMTDPQKSYHLEFVVRNEALCPSLMALLEGCCGLPRLSRRRGIPLVYYKECTPIEDLLALMGAVRSSLEMVDIEIVKNVRNQANRVTNCETANIDKTINASAQQMEDIRFILDGAGEQVLPENLREIAYLRLENPHLSLRELAELVPGGISRSGLHHRLAKLGAIADGLRKNKNMPEKG